jgi:hypothetical protein
MVDPIGKIIRFIPPQQAVQPQRNNVSNLENDFITTFAEAIAQAAKSPQINNLRSNGSLTRDVFVSRGGDARNV